MAAFEKIDIHNLTKEQAKIAIDAKLKSCRGDVYTLSVIHGYNSGTVLKDFVRKHYRNHEKVISMEIGMNQGQTDLILRKL